MSRLIVEIKEEIIFRIWSVLCAEDKVSNIFAADPREAGRKNIGFKDSSIGVKPPCDYDLSNNITTT